MNRKRHLDGRGKGQLIYDFKYDTLTFKIKGRNYKKSVEFQNFIIDIDEEDFVTGIRIMDVSKVSGLNKFLFRNLIHGEFNASITDNVINVRFKFIGRMRNKAIPILPLFMREKDFTQQFTTPVNSKYPMADSEVVVPEIVA